jgi:hypothetical protein
VFHLGIGTPPRWIWVVAAVAMVLMFGALAVASAKAAARRVPRAPAVVVDDLFPVTVRAEAVDPDGTTRLLVTGKFPDVRVAWSPNALGRISWSRDPAWSAMAKDLDARIRAQNGGHTYVWVALHVELSDFKTQEDVTKALRTALDGPGRGFVEE